MKTPADPSRFPPGKSLRVIQTGHADRPAFDTAVSRAILLRVGRGELGETLRIYRPGPVVAFGRQDTASVGYPEAARAARAQGFDAVERLAGGRAAVFHDQTLAFAWTLPTDQPRLGIEERFSAMAALTVRVLVGLGIDARVGEVPGEYCPGRYSVNARGLVKLMGVGQRLAGRAAHVGGVIVVDGADRVRDVLLPVYRHLGLHWDPTTVGSVRLENESAGLSQVREGLMSEFARQRRLVPVDAIDAATLALAEHLARPSPA